MGSKNTSPFLTQTWSVKGWTDGWTVAKPYHVEGEVYLFLLKSAGYGGDDKNVHVMVVRPGGKLGEKRFTKHWTEGWTSAEFFQDHGRRYLLLLKERGFGSAGNNLHVGAVSAFQGEGMEFLTAWAISSGVLVGLAVMAGYQVQFAGVWKPFGILIDDRERFSLNRFQLTMWTILILSTFLALILANVGSPTAAMAIPNELLGLLGISLGTGVVAGAVKDGKNILRPGKIGGGPDFVARLPVAVRQPLNPGVPPRFAQVFLEEEGDAANKVVNVTKFQNFIFTIALGVVYVVLTYKARGYATFGEQALWLLGISHGTYVGGKVPSKD